MRDPLTKCWRRKKQCFLADIPSRTHNWLFDPRSLTARLIRQCDGRFRVKVLGENYRTPAMDEARALKMRPRSCAIVREVFLLCNEEPWVYARTVIPYTTLKGPPRRLAYLGEKPLGALLFADPSMKRSEVEVICLPQLNLGHLPASLSPPVQSRCVWGRRSIFYLQNKPLMVSEFFLDALTGRQGGSSAS